MNNWLGYRWLAEHYGVEPVQPFRIESRLARSRLTERKDGFTHESYPPHFQPADTLAGHLTFAFKREGIHLEFLARLFAVLPQAALESWIHAEPSGQYARRAGFFYEYLSGRLLKFSGVNSGNYIDALDPDLYLTASQPENISRWRVRDNLPGNADYCPLVWRSDKVRAAENYDCASHLHALESEYGEDLLIRSAVWLTVKESKASFAIEREDKHIGRVQRFAAVMEKRCGQYANPLEDSAITALQSEILGPRAIRTGRRQSPVFVGAVDSTFVPVVHYVAPHWKDTAAMMTGLSVFADLTIGKPALLRAAVLSFGFVYIHPMTDGNGRISRFLINDVLRRDQAIPAPFVLPVSATITSSSSNRRSYDQILEIFSRPLMQRYQHQLRFGPEITAADGIRTNLYFDAYEDARPAWRYPDLTEHVEYLAQVIEITIDTEMRNEASYLRKMRKARLEIKEFIEGPDADIDRLIRSLRDNKGTLSNKLKHDFPMLDEADLAAAVSKVVQSIFDIKS